MPPFLALFVTTDTTDAGCFGCAGCAILPVAKGSDERAHGTVNKVIGNSANVQGEDIGSVPPRIVTARCGGRCWGCRRRVCRVQSLASSLLVPKLGMVRLSVRRKTVCVALSITRPANGGGDVPHVTDAQRVGECRHAGRRCLYMPFSNGRYPVTPRPLQGDKETMRQ